jgi:hypothetical protein
MTAKASNADAYSLVLDIGATYDASSAAEKSRAVSGAVKLAFFQVYNKAVATRYVHLFAGVAVPTNGSVPLLRLNANASSASSPVTLPVPICFEAGYILVCSSTQETLTIAAADDMYFTSAYQETP